MRIHQKRLVKQHFWLRLWLWLRCGSEWGVLVNAAWVKVGGVVVVCDVSGCGVVVSGLLYISDAAEELLCVDHGGCSIIEEKVLRTTV